MDAQNWTASAMRAASAQLDLATHNPADGFAVAGPVR
jgi:hypothetical protein